MKRLVLILGVICLAQWAWAQKEVAIETLIGDKINQLEINSGWDVRMSHCESDSLRIAIVVPEQFAGLALEAQICNISDDILTLVENKKFPQGTIVEMEGKLNFKKIEILDNAKASVNCINLAEKQIIELANKAELHIGHLLSAGESSLTINERALLHIDTIAGKGEIMIALYDADFQYDVCLLDGKVIVNEFESPKWFYVRQTPKVIQTKTVDGQPVTTEKFRIWERIVAYNISAGFKVGPEPNDISSPYSMSGGLFVSGGVETSFRLGRQFKLSTGLSFNSTWMRLNFPVEMGENGLEVLDGPETFQQNALYSGYLCVPVTLYYHFGKQKLNSFSLDFTTGYLLNGQLLTSYPELVPNAWIGTEYRSLFNPWKMEVGISFNTNIIGIIHGFRVYTNLLPEFNKNFTTEKFKSFGFEIKF